jgi:hypothetical protein
MPDFLIASFSSPVPLEVAASLAQTYLQLTAPGLALHHLSA